MDPAANLSSKIWKEYSTRNQPTNNISHEDRSMLLNLSFLEQKIHQLQDLVRLTVTRDKRAVELSEIFPVQRQQLMTADITSIIVQLISAAASLLPSLENSLLINPVFGQLQSISGVGFAPSSDGHKPQYEEHILKDEGVNQPLGSYEVLQLEKEEILAPHAHFCLICGKGFKRDANLRMHMRGHGDQYKTLAALAKPRKEPGLEPVLTKRYSCPYSGCKHNKDHINFQPLKTMLCVKNHYKRTHCDKNYTCSRCNRKMFSVLADLKTHEKHCGSGKWLCSCGTTFSRKEKLFGHVALFQGHTPAIPVEKSKRSCGIVNGRGNDEASKIGGMEFRFSPSFTSGNGVQNLISSKEGLDDPTTFFSSLDYDSFNFAGFENFPPPPFDISGNSLAYHQAESSEYLLETGNEPSYASPK